MAVEVTNADRVIFPEDGITKGDVVAYYALVADRMVPFIAGRVLTVERFPKGIGAKGFMQKNVPDHYSEDFIGRHEVPKEGGGTTVYPMVDSADGIAYYANLARLPEKVAPAVVEFMLGPLLENPDRVGEPLLRELTRYMSARRGAYRIVYRIDDASTTVEVVRIDHRSRIYRFQ